MVMEWPRLASGGLEGGEGRRLGEGGARLPLAGSCAEERRGRVEALRPTPLRSWPVALCALVELDVEAAALAGRVIVARVTARWAHREGERVGAGGAGRGAGRVGWPDAVARA